MVRYFRKNSKLNRKRNKEKGILALLLAQIMLVSLAGCASQNGSVVMAEDSNFLNETKKEAEITLVGCYDSADTAVLEYLSQETKSLTLMNLQTGKSYALEYNGATNAYNQYGDAISMAQLKVGDIVNVQFLKSNRILANIQVSPEAWTYDHVTKYDLNGRNSTATIGENTYSLSPMLKVFSGDWEGELFDIVKGDVLTVSGIGSTIFSVEVTGGHGYISLMNDQALVGGWIEVGNQAITKVSDSMLLTVPEGSYQVKMYHNSSATTQMVTVDRGQEVVLDASEIQVEEEKNGMIKFQLLPKEAVLEVDGVPTDYSQVVTLSYGIHRMEVSASGYDTVSKYINVGEELATIVLSLEKSAEKVTTPEPEPEPELVEQDTDTDQTTLGELNDKPVELASETATLKNSTGKRTDSNVIDLGGGSNGVITGAYEMESGEDSGEDIGTPAVDDPTISGNEPDTPGSGTEDMEDGLEEIENDPYVDLMDANNVVSTRAGEKVYIDGPAHAQVYVDGQYIGIAPCSFYKVDGSHTLTFKSEGFETRSYTIYLYYDDSDISYSFPSLKPASNVQ